MSHNEEARPRNESSPVPTLSAKNAERMGTEQPGREQFRSSGGAAASSLSPSKSRSTALISAHSKQAMFVPLACREQARCASLMQARLRPLREEMPRHLRSGSRRMPALCACGAASISTQPMLRSSPGKGILRETLERAAFMRRRHRVLAGEPWAYRNRIRLAFDANEDADTAAALACVILC